MQDKAIANQFKEYTAEISKLNAKDFIRRDDLDNELCFEVLEEDLERTINLFKLLADIDMSGIPNNVLQNLNNEIKNFIDKLVEIRNYSAKSGSGTRDSIINNFRARYDAWYSVISPIVAFTTKAGTDYEALMRKAREANENLQRELALAKTERDEAREEIRQVLESVKKAAAEVGVTQHTTNFKDATDYYDRQKNWWLIGCCVLVIIIVLMAGYFIWKPVEIKEPYQYTFLTSILPRMGIILALLYALHIASYTYRAQAHNFVVNKSKQNALATFETFVNAAEDQDTKNAVLKQTTNAIFDNLPSGYLKNEGNNDSPVQIVEVMKDLTKG